MSGWCPLDGVGRSAVWHVDRLDGDGPRRVKKPPFSRSCVHGRQAAPRPPGREEIALLSRRCDGLAEPARRPLQRGDRHVRSEPHPCAHQSQDRSSRALAEDGCQAERDRRPADQAGPQVGGTAARPVGCHAGAPRDRAGREGPRYPWAGADRAVPRRLGRALPGAADRGRRAGRFVRSGGVAVLSVEVLTLFPRMVAAPLEESILAKARDKGLLRVQVTDVRDFAGGKHRVTDDVPYGGGAGMVMKPEPLVAAIEAARRREPSARVLLLSPQGARFDQGKALELAGRGALIVVCGRYEGVDERVLRWVDEEISLGDFVLTGGEFAALAVIDAVARLVPGVLGNELSAQADR